MAYWRSCLFVALVGLAAAPASAGNRQPFFLGNDAAMTGGALTAVTDDAAAAWYNPAGLGAIGRAKIDVSASAFVLRVRTLPGVLKTDLPSSVESADLSSTKLLSVPSALVYARNVGGGVTLAFGVFVPYQEAADARTTLRTEDVTRVGEPFTYDQHLDFSMKSSEYHLGFAAGWQVAPTLRLGASLVGIYASLSQSVRFWVDLEAPGKDASARAVALREQGDDVSGLGGYGVVSLQWELAPGWLLGAVVRTPGLMFKRWADQTTLSLSAATGTDQPPSAALDYDEQEPSDSDVHMVTPLSMTLALGYRTKGGWFGVEGDVELPLENVDLGIDTRLLWNLRVGGRFQLTDHVHAGLGVFTDRSNAPEPEDLAATHVDFYGLTLGVELRSPHALQDKPDPEALVFSTTIALRYAYGVGRSGGVMFKPLADPSENIESFTTDVHFNELALHIGSTLYF